MIFFNKNEKQQFSHKATKLKKQQLEKSEKMRKSDLLIF
jgi:hypothetical protein